jgi:hypothetical protein
MWNGSMCPRRGFSNGNINIRVRIGRLFLDKPGADDCKTCSYRRYNYITLRCILDRLCGLVVRVPGYRSRGPCSIPGATRFYEKCWVWNWAILASRVQLSSYLEEMVATMV